MVPVLYSGEINHTCRTPAAKYSRILPLVFSCRFRGREDFHRQIRSKRPYTLWFALWRDAVGGDKRDLGQALIGTDPKGRVRTIYTTQMLGFHVAA
jgi:hypothetical protein